jgi:uncharacterized repeat protein (TIGR02543 family)
MKSLIAFRALPTVPVALLGIGLALTACPALTDLPASTPNPPAETYTITYDGNGNLGGTVPVDPGTYETGKTVTVSGNTGNLAKSGYSFAGWNTNASGSGTTYLAGTSLTMGSANLTLYALWLVDTFPYTTGSNFLFVIKDGTSSVSTTKMTWDVTSYDATTAIATIAVGLDPPTTKTPLPATIYFRNGTGSLLEYSTSGTAWTPMNRAPGTAVTFLFGTKAGRPSSLVGSVVNSVKTATVSFVGETSGGVAVSSEYDSSRYDSYMFTQYTREYYSDTVGFTGGISFTSDLSMLPAYTYKREVELVSYRVNMPDGTVREGGASIPAAPSGLSASYTYKYRIYVFKYYSGYYEYRSYVTLHWTDNSDNEIEFKLYMKGDDGEYHPASERTDMTINPTSFASDKQSATLQRGYYAPWPTGKFYFKLKANNATGESDFSNEASVTTR